MSKSLFKKLDDSDIAFFLGPNTHTSAADCNFGPPPPYPYDELGLTEEQFSREPDTLQSSGIRDVEGGRTGVDDDMGATMQWNTLPLVPTVTGSRIRAAQQPANTSNTWNANPLSPPNQFQIPNSLPSTSTSQYSNSNPNSNPVWKSSGKSVGLGIGMVIGAPVGLVVGVAGAGVFAVGSALVGAGKVVNGVGQLLTGGVWDGISRNGDGEGVLLEEMGEQTESG
ncbi:hypothetical protein BDN72DRAFT_834414 [Pluteus cervinus]|uniref:Uncharacterized protein n=1 Tax=Pluteus cervinus TaxID=181527 RepID=A0ACD3B6S9_9AGAR|nr:hypothetical protein BDN72DRAFT_834414 [Pluteus cervinus]